MPALSCLRNILQIREKWGAIHMDRRIEKTRKSIREVDLLMKNRNGKITIAEIARKANIDRKTFYLHYDTIDDIIKEFAQESKLTISVQRLKEDYVENQPIDVYLLFDELNHIIEENMEGFGPLR